MDRKRWLVAVSVVAVVLAAGVLMLGGTGPATSNVSSPSPDGAPSGTAGVNDTAGVSDTTVVNDTAGESDTAGTGEEWSFTIDSIESCGNTCRDVTATLKNTGSTTQTGVTVTTKVYADGELLWDGTEDAGTLEPGEANTATKRVDVGFDGAVAIESNDGYVTIRTVVSYDGGRTVFENRKQVA